MSHICYGRGPVSVHAMGFIVIFSVQMSHWSTVAENKTRIVYTINYNIKLSDVMIELDLEYVLLTTNN